MRIENVEVNADFEDILHELRNQLAINQIPLLSKEPKQSGNSLQVQCPYHSDGQERRASAGFRKSDGKFHCFSCGEIHTFPEVVSHCFGKDDMGNYGWQWLIRNFGTVEKEERKDVELDYRRRSADNIRSSTDDNYVTEEELEKYRYYHPYMYKRKLTDEIIDLFDIGYDKKTKCITFPVRDIHGNCLFIARRSVNSKYFNYPQNVDKPLYGIYELKKIFKVSYRNSKRYFERSALFPSEIIVCESMLDALTCLVYGKYAIALNGTGSYNQYKLLEELPFRELILATDNDSAGKRAREKIRKNVRNKIITEYDYTTYPVGCKDINDMTKDQFLSLQKIF